MTQLTREQVYERLAEIEKEAWLRVAGKPPGSPLFDQDEWDSWRSALHAVCNAVPRSMYTHPNH